jgi:hypothetical protein
MNSKERSIIFSTEMVNALLARRKTQTRRLVKGEDLKLIGMLPEVAKKSIDLCRYGKTGDRLWVREKIYCCEGSKLPKFKPEHLSHLWNCGCDYATNIDGSEFYTVTKVISPIYMPRWCCRIELVLTEVSIEQVSDISEADAIAEGLIPKVIDNQTCLGMSHGEGTSPTQLRKYGLQGYRDEEYIGNPRIVYKRLWDSLNQAEGTRFLDSPWVWVLKFDVCPIRL